MLSRLLSLWAKNSTPLWIVWKRVNVCLNTSLMPTFPFFLCLPLPTTPLPNTAPHHHSLAATALSAILSRRFLISFDHCQLIRGQHLGGRHGNRQDQIFSALKGGLRFARRGGGQWEIFPGLTALMAVAEQNRSLDDASLSMCFCTHVGVYVLPHFPWVRCPSRGPSPVGKGGVEGYLCVCVYVWE